MHSVKTVTSRAFYKIEYICSIITYFSRICLLAAGLSATVITLQSLLFIILTWTSLIGCSSSVTYLMIFNIYSLVYASSLNNVWRLGNFTWTNGVASRYTYPSELLDLRCPYTRAGVSFLTNYFCKAWI